MNTTNPAHKKILLHACCGPCSLEPIRLYKEAYIEPSVFFSNSNIAPVEEYNLRLDTIKKYCKNIQVEFIEDVYNNDMWIDCTKDHMKCKQDRCRQCYKMRFERACIYAVDHGFDTVSTTLTISPYQYLEIIEEELLDLCKKYELNCGFKDFSEYYYNAQKKAKELGLYRQHYCGCISSKVEAEQEKLQQQMEKIEATQIREAQLNIKRKKKQAYQNKKAKQREILQQLRQKDRNAHK